MNKANVLVLIGSASKDSSNGKLMEVFRELIAADFEVTIVDDLGALPHFDPAFIENLPVQVSDLLSRIEDADGVVFCSPEYIFSIPARLKNLFEWCVSTTVFLDKPAGFVTASADGRQAHAQLKLIVQTLGGRTNDESELLVAGIKGKFNDAGVLSDPGLSAALSDFANAFKILMQN